MAAPARAPLIKLHHGARASTLGGVRALVVLRQHDAAITARVKADVASALAGERTIDAVIAAAERAHAALDDAGRRTIAKGALTIACAAGCSYCCHVHADVTVPELLAITRHLDQAWTEARRGALRERLALQIKRVEHLSDEARWAAKIPCALLDDAGRCSIHAARPLRCRAFNASHVEPCREAFHGSAEATPARIPRLDRAHDAAEAGYDAALTDAGLAATAHRLEVGLLLALDDPGAGARWLAGEEAFARARSPEI
ncbi:MAG: YkgJ family cysteine cluster protein [Byssovorax sp.]